ncbi:hypothetical protein [Sandaracinobacteroides hominis]|uniref:hypothetical protein n=1 Tax=Sandaracinobacteroides hominis TaxID=2780086 RepID=UPI0018F3ADB6|nr:hypothetical protein [Sandaracinobacteroides hominis]
MALALATSGCVSAIKQSEVQTAMQGVGFTQEDARCAGARAGRQLSARELISLQRAASRLQQPVREMKVGDVMDAFTENVQPSTLATVARIGAECAQQRQARVAETPAQ